MSIILDNSTKILVQGITGKESSFWTKKMLEAGTNIVAGVTPGKGGIEVHGIPVYDLVEEAKLNHDIDMAVLYVPAMFTKDAVIEVLEAGIKKAVLLADGVPVHDMIDLKVLSLINDAMLIGPNTPGISTPGKAMVGFIPFWLKDVYRKGNIGIISRSGTLTNEISSQITAAGCGISTIVGCGGDSVPGTRFTEVLQIFEYDDETEVIVIVGEIGGSMEEEVATYIIENNYKKPVLAYIAGRSAPPGKRMGHAGAIISRGKGSAKTKKEFLVSAGVLVADTPSEIKDLLQQVWK